MAGPLWSVSVLAGAGVAFCWAAQATSRRQLPATNTFALSAATAGVGALLIAVAHAANAPPRLRWAVGILVGLVLPLPWLLFSLEYTGRGDLAATRSSVLALPIVLGAVSMLLIFGSQVLQGMSLPSPETATGLIAPVVGLLSLTYSLSLLYAGGVLLVGTGLLLLTFTDAGHLNSNTGVLLGVFGTVPWLLLLFGIITGPGGETLPVAGAIGFGVGAVAGVLAVGRQHPFETVAAAGTVGPETVMSELEGVVIVTDSEETVAEVNRSAAETLPDADAAVGGALEELLGSPVAAVRDAETIELTTAEGRALFAPNVSELTDQHGRCLGYAVVLRDVTRRVTREQRLEVLNRALRHNLRNDTNVLLAHAQRLETAVEDDTLADSARTIEATTRDLASLGDQARSLEKLLSGDERRENLTLATRCEAVRDRYEAADRVEWTVAVPDGIRVAASRRLLEAALDELVGNAIQHSTGPVSVTIEASYSDDRRFPVELSVVDDGPGLSDQDRATIRSGTETALQHGSGMGLWVVRWATTRLGGELVIPDRDDGTTVTIRLPNADLNQEPAVDTAADRTADAGADD